MESWRMTNLQDVQLSLETSLYHLCIYIVLYILKKSNTPVILRILRLQVSKGHLFEGNNIYIYIYICTVCLPINWFANWLSNPDEATQLMECHPYTWVHPEFQSSNLRPE